MKLFELIDKNDIILSELDGSEQITKVTHRVDECEGALLVIPNDKRIPSEFKTRPRAIVCGADAKVPSGIPTVRVLSQRRTTSRIYSRLCNIDHTKFKLIGVTGTNGKTSTAAFIRHAAEACGMKVGILGTGMIKAGEELLSEDYYSMTTPDPWVLYPAIKKMELAGCELIVMEVSSHALELQKVEPLKFDLGIFTNLSMEHLDFHQDMESYYNAKKKLFYSCDKAIINIDDYYGRRLAREIECERTTSGILWRGETYASNIINRGFDGIEYIYHGGSFSFTMKLRAAGVYNIYNSMLAISACCELGLKPCDIKKALSDIPSISGRYEIIKDDITVIIDYAHTDAALENILKSLVSARGSEHRLTVVFGCGGERDKAKRARMGRIAEIYADQTIITTDNPRGEDPREIIRDILDGFVEDNYSVIVDREAAIEEAIISARRGDVVAIIGKGAEKYSIDREGYHPFDERAIISSSLAKRRGRGTL